MSRKLLATKSIAKYFQNQGSLVTKLAYPYSVIRADPKLIYCVHPHQRASFVYVQPAESRTLYMEAYT